MTKNDAVERAIEFASVLRSQQSLGMQMEDCDRHTITLADALLALQTSRPDADRLAALDDLNNTVNRWCTSKYKNVLSEATVETIRAALKSGDKGQTQQEVGKAKCVHTIHEIIGALEGAARNTDTDPRWKAASELRGIQDGHMYMVYLDKRYENDKTD